MFNVQSGNCEKLVEAKNYKNAAEKFFYSVNHSDLTEIIVVSKVGEDQLQFFATDTFQKQLPKFQLVGT